MLGWLVLLVVLVPVVELAILIEVGRQTSVGATIAAVVLTGVAGAALARRQSFSTLQRIRSETAAGRIPASELAEGLLILIAALLLITPGFLTDLLGLALLIPPSRRFFLKWLQRWFRAHLQKITVHVAQTETMDHPRQSNGQNARTSDAGRAGQAIKYVENRAESDDPPAKPP